MITHPHTRAHTQIITRVRPAEPDLLTSPRRDGEKVPTEETFAQPHDLKEQGVPRKFTALVRYANGCKV